MTREVTRKEAIKIMEHLKSIVSSEDYKEAFSMAIEALQEPGIVHCKDCVYWKAARIGICGLAGYFIGERGYCLYGKKAG